MTPMKCPHRQPPALGYLNDVSDAERRMKRGEVQYRCPICVLWIWGEYFDEAFLTGGSANPTPQELRKDGNNE